MSTKAAIIGSSILIGGPVGAFGGYKYSETSVEYTLKGKILTEKATEAWTALKDKLGKADETNLSKELKEIKTDTTDSAGTKLESWCKKNYKEIYKTIFSENKNLLKEVETYCGYTFGAQVTEAKQFTKESDSEVSTKVTEIKKQDTTVNNENLKNIKSKEEAIAKKELFEFCVNKYKEQYQGEDRAEIVKYCSK